MVVMSKVSESLAYSIITLVVAVGFAWYLYPRERCDDIILDGKELRKELNGKLHGQHLVIPTVLSSVYAHANDKNPSKPLVLSFHGSTGNGKTYVSRMIVQNLFAKKEKSSSVHFFNAVLHFKHKEKVNEYKDQLHSWIYHNVSRCERSVFIFDEMDKMPEGIMDVLIPFIDYNAHVDGVDFRKSMFIFLSNTGGSRITDAAYKHYKEGGRREDIMLRNMQDVLMDVAFTEESGLKNALLVHKHLVDHFIPFLPMERSHVRNCIMDELLRRELRLTEKSIKAVMDELSWFPDGKDGDKLYSKTGCKKVEQKVKLVMFDI